jgi:hypothetical protein
METIHELRKVPLTSKAYHGLCAIHTPRLFWLSMCQQIQYFHNSEKSVKDTTYDCQRSMVCPQYNISWRLECAVSKGSHKTKENNLPQQNRRTCKRTNSTATTTTQPKKTKKELASRPTRRLMRNCFWIILFTLYSIIVNYLTESM